MTYVRIIQNITQLVYWIFIPRRRYGGVETPSKSETYPGLTSWNSVNFLHTNLSIKVETQFQKVSYTEENRKVCLILPRRNGRFNVMCPIFPWLCSRWTDPRWQQSVDRPRSSRPPLPLSMMAEKKNRKARRLVEAQQKKSKKSGSSKGGNQPARSASDAKWLQVGIFCIPPPGAPSVFCTKF